MTDNRTEKLDNELVTTLFGNNTTLAQLHQFTLFEGKTTKDSLPYNQKKRPKTQQVIVSKFPPAISTVDCFPNVFSCTKWKRDVHGLNTQLKSTRISFVYTNTDLDIAISIWRDFAYDFREKFFSKRFFLSFWLFLRETNVGIALTGWLLFDTQAWVAVAGKHGREVYRDDNNNVDIQQQRLVRIRQLAQREINASCELPVVKFLDFLKNLLKKWIWWCGCWNGWSTFLWLCLLFLARSEGLETERPDAWREVVLTVIPLNYDKIVFRVMKYINLLSAIKKIPPSFLADRCQMWDNVTCLGHESVKFTVRESQTTSQQGNFVEIGSLCGLNWCGRCFWLHRTLKVLNCQKKKSF